MYSPIFELIYVESLIFENQQNYYDAIEISRKNNSSTQFIEFMLEMIFKGIETLKPSFKRIIIDEVIMKQLTKSEKALLQVLTLRFEINEYFTLEDIREIVNKQDANIRKYLITFVEVERF